MAHDTYILTSVHKALLAYRRDNPGATIDDIVRLTAQSLERLDGQPRPEAEWEELGRRAADAPKATDLEQAHPNKIQVMLALPRGADGDDEDVFFTDYLLIETSAVPRVGDCVEIPTEYDPETDEVAIAYLAPVTAVAWRPWSGCETATVTLQPPVPEDDDDGRPKDWYASPEAAADAGPANLQA